MKIFNAVTKLQRNVRKFLARRKHERQPPHFTIYLEPKKELKGRQNNIPRSSTIYGVSQIEASFTQQNPKDVFQERAALARKKSRLFDCIKKYYPLDKESVVEECKACVNFKDQKQNTPLFYAAKGNKISLCQQLLLNGANVNTENENSNTVLHIAMQKGYVELASIFLSHGADLYSRNNKMETPLMLANGSTIKWLWLENKPISK